MTARLLGEQLTLSQLRREDLRERLFALLDALDDNAGAAVLRSTQGLLDAISTRVAGLDAGARQAFDWRALWGRILAEGVLPAARLPASGVTAGTYASPSSMTVDAAGRVTAISAGSAVSESRQVIAGTGLSGGGPLSADVTLSHAASAVTAGTYASPSSVTVDARGHVTAISAGSGGFGCWSTPIITINGSDTYYNIPEGSRPAAGEGVYYAVVTLQSPVTATLMSEDNGGGSPVSGALDLSVPGQSWVIDGTDPVQSGVPKSILLSGGGSGVQFRVVKIGG